MAFVESRLLDRLTIGTQGGPTWNTRKVSLNSGIERRNPRRARPKYRFIISRHPLVALFSAGDVQAVIMNMGVLVGAFNACRGGVDGFRLKDPMDWIASDELLPVLGTGAPQSLQLIKTYAFGSNAVVRPIRKPVSGSVVLTDDGVPFAASIDYTTGIATYTASVGGVVRWSGHFDVPVKFSSDELLMDTVGGNVSGLVLTADMDLEEDLAE